MKGKIFNTQEVQAIIAGNKRMFREVIKFSKNKTTREFQEIALKKISEGFSEYNVCLNDLVKCPYQVGQKIFCKEKFSVIKNIDFNYPPHDWRRDGRYIYEADAARSFGMYGCVKWKPAQHMKQEHSRLTLMIKEIRVERLQDIKPEDAIREGFRETKEIFPEPNVLDKTISAYGNFVKNWNATHKKPEEKFEASPFCWVVSFEIINN